MTQAIESYGGVVRSFMGDGVAAFFGLEGAREDDPVRAALAALRIVEVISAYAAEIEAAWSIPGVTVRVGVNSGRVATGLVGGARPIHVALGDSVNVASRLQNWAQPGSIVIGGMTASRLSGSFDLESIGPLEIRGRSQRVDAWRLLGFRGHAAELRPTHFVGRSAELEHLSAAAAELQRGRGQIRVISGEAGIGKTTLITEFRNRTQSELLWMWGCSHERVMRPYGPFVEILRTWLGIDERTPEVVVRVRLLARVREVIPEAADEVLPYLSQLLGAELDGLSKHFWRQSIEARAEAIRRAYVRWLAALAQRQPVVVTIDELDQAEESTTSLVGELFALTDRVPLMIVLALRPEPRAAGWRARVAALAEYSHRAEEMRLDCLSLSESDELIALIDAEGSMSAALRRDLTVRAEGNPLYLEELARASLASEYSGRSGPRSSDELPPALEGLLLSRIDRLDQQLRGLLQMAAVCGRRFERELLERAWDRPSLEWLLPMLVRERLLQEDGRTPDQCYAFRHGLYQEVVLSTLTPSRLRLLHEKVARALESMGRELAPERVADHYVASGNHVKAVEFLETAGKRAAALSSLSEALDYLDRGREVATELDDGAVYVRLTHTAARLSRDMGRYEDAIGRWTRLAETSGPDEHAATLLEIAKTHVEAGEGDRASRMCERALARDPNPQTRAALMVLMARLELRRGNVSQVERFLERSSELVECAAAELELERASVWAGYQMQRGEFGLAEDWAQRALKVAHETGDFGATLKAKRDLGVIQLVFGRLVDAREILHEVYREAVSGAHTVRACEAVANLVCAYLLLGELNDGVHLARETLEWLSVVRWRTAVLANLGELELELGRSDEARVHLTECIELSARDVEAEVGQLAQIHLSKVLADSGDVAGAEVHVREALRGSHEGRLDLKLRAQAQLADLLLERKEFDAALSEAREVQLKAEACDLTERPLALRTLGKVQALVGDAQARSSVMLALKLSQEMGMRLEQARALTALGVLDGQPLSPHFREAREIFARCGSERGLAEVRKAVAGLSR